ncbi:MAG: rod shape-determining protein MreC [Candidatus Marinimicrobia bacterium]|nr:rod shape-determining protein MreC [Candidatus Neomarinimicrobiota bacterium]
MRNLFELLYQLRELLTLLLALLVSLTLLITNQSRQSVFLQESYAELTALIPRPSLGLSDLFSYRDENAVLRDRLMQYSLLNAELAATARENEQLRAMLRFARRSPHHLQAAEVISRGAAALLSTVTINVGRVHGVRVNDPVLALDGLMGKVLSVSNNAAVVHLITDKNFRVSVKLGNTAIRGILRPESDTKGVINGIAPNSPVAIGDEVVTSGFSDIYPRNLPVATVSEVAYKPGENFSMVRVRLYARPSEAEHLFVLMGDDGNR